MSHTFNFICRECTPNERFTIEREESDLGKVGKVFCPGCGRQWGTGVKIEWNDVSHLSVRPSRNSEAVGKENSEMSRAASDEARRDREHLDRTNPEVMPGVRKSQVDTINEKMGQIIQGL